MGIDKNCQMNRLLRPVTTLLPRVGNLVPPLLGECFHALLCLPGNPGLSIPRLHGLTSHVQWTPGMTVVGCFEVAILFTTVA
jgi:hypothetical protein